MHQKAGRLLKKLWAESPAATGSVSLPQEITNAIDRSINSKTKTYRYVLPTQLLAKLVNKKLNCLAIQKGADLENAFDARSLCHSVIVDFDRANHGVLGGSKEPYLSKPLRIRSVTSEFRKQQKNKAGYDDLCSVLSFAQVHPELVGQLMKVTLGAIRARLTTAHIVYPVPRRISLSEGRSVISSFISERSGGFRLQTVALGLFRTIGDRMRLYKVVKSAPVNASDASTGLAADLTCFDDAGRTVFAIEVKDRRLTLHDVEDKLPGIRERGIGELLFLVQGGTENSDKNGVTNLIEHQFASGQNIYVCEFDVFLEACLILLAEGGRRQFFVAIGECIDELRGDIRDREAWKALLEAV